MAKKSSFSAVVLAAGRGQRMKSALPKVLHPVAGKPMVGRVIKAAQDAGAAEVRVVVGSVGESLVRQVVEPMGATCFRQAEARGTADAVRAADPEDLDGAVLILNGDHPLIEAEDLRGALAASREFDLAVVTTRLKDPGHYGRIVRQGGSLRAIVEAKDASSETLKINEINTGLYVVKADVLRDLLPKIGNQNAQGEYYLTDLVTLAIEHRKKVTTIELPRRVAAGVNSQIELSRVTRYAFRAKARRLMDAGVMIIDPDRTYIEDDVEVGPSSVIYPGVFLKGKTRVGEYCVIEPQCFLVDAKLGDSVQLKAGSYLESAQIGSKCVLGPYARIRPDTELSEGVQIGNFVELKKTKMGRGSKAAHLTYLGDAIIGENTNIGCGTITCNYAVDRKKYVTEIGSNVFVGSDTQLVAPIKIGDSAVIGSGSTITKDVPARALAVARSKQFIKEDYVKPTVATDDGQKKK
jgi:bifunctional UDP-N-acetylglucosamine pyrophosphorylase / glucosamine-1-phosphate N-acetyltransferase